MTLPSGRTVTNSFRSTGYLHDDEASRVTQILVGATPVATYNYNGLDTVVGTTLDEPDVMSKQFGSTSGSFPDLDRFNRVVTSKWTKDLATDRDFYRVDLGYDRNSNIVSAEDQVHAGFDVLYTNDDLNRLVRAEEGTLSGGSITSRTRDQQWTLTQVGNWDVDKVDLNGDGDFLDAEELEDARTHNAVNELNARDIDNDSSDDYSLAYDEAGNLTDDGESYTYEWDAFYRLRKIRDRSTSDLVAEYKYNGLGYRISIHEDTDDDSDVDATDKWFHHAFDERWRWVATFREDDSDPKEEFLHHAAGLDGRGTGSYIDLVILRDRDINSGWTSAADGTLEERIYYCQNWRADVSALVTDAGQMLEWVKYSAYGVPFGLPGGDADSDGDCDAADLTQVTTWVEMGPYDVRGDVDLDGDVDEKDSSTISSDYSGITLGRGVLSDDAVGNRRGYAGYELNDSLLSTYRVRHRNFSPQLGRWIRRDPSEQLSGINAVEYAWSSPMTLTDPSGLTPVSSARGVETLPPNTIPCATGITYARPSSLCFGKEWRLFIDEKPEQDPGHSTGEWLILTEGTETYGGTTVTPCKAFGNVKVKIQILRDDGKWEGLNPRKNPSDQYYCKHWHGNRDCLGGNLTWWRSNAGIQLPPTGFSEAMPCVDMTAQCNSVVETILEATADSGMCQVSGTVRLWCDKKSSG